MFMSAKSMNSMTVAILTMGMAVLAGQYACTTDSARRAGAERVIKDDAPFSETVYVDRIYDAVPVTARDTAPVIRDEEHHAAILQV
jgi:hypothetical protein